MRRWIAAGILIAAAAGCGDEARPSPSPVLSPPGSDLPRRSDNSPGTPAGEVPPDSRVARDADGAPAAAFVGFDYAFPGPPGSAGHYHVRVPDSGAASAVVAGGAGSLAVRAWRVASASDAAAAARDALRPLVADLELLDPATAGGCGTEAGHSGAAGTRRVPPVRVVRARGTREALAAAARAAAALPGLEPMLEADFEGGAAGDAWLDLHLVEK